VLLLREIGDRAGSGFDRYIESIQAAEVVGAAETVASERFDDALHFRCDGVAAGELGDIEDGPEETLREEMLDEHLVDRLAADVGIERLAAELEEGRERRLKTGVAGVRLLDLFGEAAGKLGDSRAEFADGGFEIADGGFGVGVELEEQVGELAGVGEVDFDNGRAVLIEDGAVGVLEDGVGERIAAADLALDFAGEVVARVLGFPVAAGERVGVANGAVGTDLLAGDRDFFGELPAEEPAEPASRLAKGRRRASSFERPVVRSSANSR
jgi:hypothetical protein